uniref:Uncharacterized protein n=1 Tax=Tolypothrix bouteillei VB521301 TaxID=1479485 RepID=A0A0C1N566_9CYAN
MSLKISQYVIQQFQNCALKAYKHGKLVESCGLVLQMYNHFSVAQEDSLLITRYGLGIKYNADKSFQYLRLLNPQGNDSIEFYYQSVQGYTNAVRTHIKAMNLYLSITQKYISKNQH